MHTTTHHTRTRFFSRALLATMALCLLLATGCAHTAPQRDVLYQLSTIDALLAGVYDPAGKCGELLRHGDFGLGTFTGLDGEMVVFEGAAYRVGVDGTVVRMPDDAGTPFAAVTSFEPDIVFALDEVADFDALKAALDARLPGANLFHAVRVTGLFSFVKTRSVPKQTPPYPPLVEVAKKQAVFTRENVRGTLVGLYAPAFAAKVNVPGYHFHFLSDDLAFGGHVLDVRGSGLEAALDPTSGLDLRVPESGPFQDLDLGRDKGAELHAVEQDVKAE